MAYVLCLVSGQGEALDEKRVAEDQMARLDTLDGNASPAADELHGKAG